MPLPPDHIALPVHYEIVELATNTPQGSKLNLTHAASCVQSSGLIQTASGAGVSVEARRAVRLCLCTRSSRVHPRSAASWTDVASPASATGRPAIPPHRVCSSWGSVSRSADRSASQPSTSRCQRHHRVGQSEITEIAVFCAAAPLAARRGRLPRPNTAPLRRYNAPDGGQPRRHESPDDDTATTADAG